MPQPRSLAPEIRESIAQQIGVRSARSAALRTMFSAGPAGGLGESLKLMMLPESAVRDGRGGGLAERIVDTGQWHHQVYNGGGEATGFARSLTTPGLTAPGGESGAHDVVEVSRSTLPHALSETIAWVDLNMPEDATADLLVAPAYALTALWIHGDGTDAVVVSSVGRSIREMPLNTRLDSADFLRRLALNDPIIGAGRVPPAP